MLSHNESFISVYGPCGFGPGKSKTEAKFGATNFVCRNSGRKMFQINIRRNLPFAVHNCYERQPCSNDRTNG